MKKIIIIIAVLILGAFAVKAFAATQSYVYVCDSTHQASVNINNVVTRYYCDANNQLVILVSSPTVSPLQ